MRFTLRTHRTFAEDATSRGLAGFGLGCILAVHTGLWLLIPLLPLLAVPLAKAATRGPMHTRGAEVLHATVLASVAPFILATILDYRSPAGLLASVAAVWPVLYILIRLQTRRTCRRMAELRAAREVEHDPAASRAPAPVVRERTTHDRRGSRRGSRDITNQLARIADAMERMAEIRLGRRAWHNTCAGGFPETRRWISSKGGTGLTGTPPKQQGSRSTSGRA